jgi:CRISPR-associated endonuclease Csn1
LQKLDQQLWESWRGRMPSVAAPAQVLPYFLRTRALDHALDPHELGRALYHLGQRRGFKSNRKEGRKLEDADASGKTKKTKPKDADDPGKVLADIDDLSAKLKNSGARTLGEFFSRLDPLDPASEKIRRRWTGRKMFESEFEAIWSAQAQHNSALTAELKQRLQQLLFFQRPIAGGKPGLCELEKGCPRAPLSALAPQRFRLLQKLNDLAILDIDGNRISLSQQQRSLVLQRLESKATLSFAEIRKAMGLPKSTKFNLEATDDHLKGNRTAATMIAAFGEDKWNAFSDLDQKRIVRHWSEIEDAEELAAFAEQNWGLDRQSAALLCKEPEAGYSRLSLKALSKLLPKMETGMSYAAARRQAYGNEFSGMEPKDLLPPVEDVLPQIPNPAVLRALSEVRKVVNAIVRTHGKPAKVRLELARDLKRSAKDRAAMQKGMGRNKALNNKQAKKIAEELTNGREASRDEIQRAILFTELSECAYCGKPFEFSKLFQYEVDHILPRSRFQDNSLNNKVLACFNCNKLKKGRTPYEAFSSTEQWEQIQVRVRKLRGDKRKRFTLSNAEELEKFSARHLADTRYITKLAARYMEQLYGGRDVEAPQESPEQLTKQAVFASSGQMTASLRRQWQLESILKEPLPSENGQNKGKPRTDHRHHAIDAIVIALSSPAMVHHFARAAAASASGGSESNSGMSLPSPWPNFVESVTPHIENIVVSHRPNHRLNGTLHEETNYGPPRAFKNKTFAHVRKAVHLLTIKQIASDEVIVDKAVRIVIRAKLEALGGDPAKFENDPPLLSIGDGKAVPVRKVRIRVSTGMQAVATGPRERHVALKGNHHVCLFLGKDKKGRPTWESPGVVSRFDAMQRNRKGEPIIQRHLGPAEDSQFLFSLMGDDIIEMDDVKGGRNLFVVRTISESSAGRIELALARHTDSRLKKEIQAADDWIRINSLETLRKTNCRKVTVDPLGNVHPCND